MFTKKSDIDNKKRAEIILYKLAALNELLQVVQICPTGSAASYWANRQEVHIKERMSALAYEYSEITGIDGKVLTKLIS